MTPARLLLALRTVLTAAVFACAALVIDYMNPGDPAFCGAQSSCMKVRTSDLGKQIAEALHGVVPGATLPQVALLLFAAVLGASFFAKSRSQVRALAAANVLAGVAAIGLIVAQVRMGHLCAYCMIVDTSALLGAIAAVALAVRTKDDGVAERELGPSTGTRITLPWGVAGAAVALLPFVWARFPETPPLPEVLEKLQVPGKTTILSFTDFQCPYCRMLHPVLAEAKKGENVAFQRFMVPLDGHPGAMPAALAYLCAPEDKREALADALYSASDVALTYEGVTVMAEGVGADRTAMVECMGSVATKEKVAEQKRLFFDELAGQGLPTTYVGRRIIKGARLDALRSAVSSAGGPDIELPLWLLFALSGAVVLGTAVLTERRLRSES